MSKIESNYVISAETQNCFNLSNLTGTVSSISLQTFANKQRAYYFQGNQFGLNTLTNTTVDSITVDGVTSGINLLGSVTINTLNLSNHCNILTNYQSNASTSITNATIKLVDHTCFIMSYFAASNITDYNYTNYQSDIYIQNRTFNFGLIASNNDYQSKNMTIQNLSVLNNVNVNANNMNINNLSLYMSGPAYYLDNAHQDSTIISYSSILQSDRLVSALNVTLNAVQLNLGRVQLVDCQVSKLIASSYIQDVNIVKQYQDYPSGTNPAEANKTSTTDGWIFDYTTRMY